MTDYRIEGIDLGIMEQLQMEADAAWAYLERSRDPKAGHYSAEAIERVHKMGNLGPRIAHRAFMEHVTFEFSPIEEE